MPVFAALKERLEAVGQSHLLAGWDTLSAAEKSRLEKEITALDVSWLKNIPTLLQSAEIPQHFAGLQPPAVIAHPSNGGDVALWKEAKVLGEAALRSGRIAILTVAGGQGTRLDWEGPKGSFPVTPLHKKSLFQVFAEKIAALNHRYSITLPWLIMTSSVNNEATVAFFREHDFFGLKRESVHFFVQGTLPACDFEGHLLLEGPGALALAPDGHGGLFKALEKSGILDHLSSNGVDTISYFQVDNPLVPVACPATIGFHLKADADISSRMVQKKDATEKVGLFVNDHGKLKIVEYSDLPEALMSERNLEGDLTFAAGNIAVHILKTAFAQKMAKTSALPFHLARKKIKAWFPEKGYVYPQEPNGIKFEQFIFDVLSLAKNPIVIEAQREETFSPVKNATGKDSPQTCTAAQQALWHNWFKAVGIDLPVEVILEISPLWADTQEAFVERYKASPVSWQGKKRIDLR